MKRLISLTVRPGTIGLMIIFSLVLVACASSAVNTSTATESVTGSDTIQSANNSKFGQLLVTDEGMTLYNFSADTPEASSCTDIGCTKFWPPYIVSAQPTSGPGITGSLGTITRPDGSMQLTYNKQPLYTFALDKQTGDANGDGRNEFGGIWHVITLGGSAGAGSSDNKSGSGDYQY